MSILTLLACSLVGGFAGTVLVHLPVWIVKRHIEQVNNKRRRDLYKKYRSERTRIEPNNEQA